MSSPQNLRPVDRNQYASQTLGSLANSLGRKGTLWHELMLLHGTAGWGQLLAGRKSCSPRMVPASLTPLLGEAEQLPPIPEVTSQGEQSCYLCSAFFNVSNREAKSARRTNCNMKNHAFSREKGEFSTPSVSSARLYLLIRSHSNPNKHIYHHKNCHLRERSPQACISPQMFPSPIQPGASRVGMPGDAAGAPGKGQLAFLVSVPPPYPRPALLRGRGQSAGALDGVKSPDLNTSLDLRPVPAPLRGLVSSL